MLIRERTPFNDDPRPPGILERAQELFDTAVDFFAASKEPGSAVAAALDADDREPDAIDANGELVTKRPWHARFLGLWHDPLFVRLPFEERRLGFTLAALLAITLYVAFLSIAVNAVFARAAHGMDKDMGSRVTFEVMANPQAPDPVKDKQARAADLIAKLHATPGVKNVGRISDDKMTELLSPWLGTAAPPPDLPLPALLDVELDAASPASKTALSALAGTSPGVMLDDHASWENALSRSARALEFVALYVLVLGFVALALTATFAAETHFHINRDTIEILHLIGARDSAIARHMGMAVLRFAAVAAAGAFALSLVTLLVLYSSMHGLDLSFFPNFSMNAGALAGIVFTWLLSGAAATGFCFAAAYFTVLRALQRLI